MAESDLDKRVSRYLKRHGAYVVKQHGSQYGRSGVSDFLVCYRGRFLAIEDKVPNGKATPIQAYEQDQVRRAGGRAIVAQSVGDVIDLIEDENERGERVRSCVRDALKNPGLSHDDIADIAYEQAIQ